MPKTNELVNQARIDWDILYKESQDLKLNLEEYEIATVSGKVSITGYKIGEWGIHEHEFGDSLSFIVDHLTSGIKLRDILPFHYALLLAYALDKLCPVIEVNVKITDDPWRPKVEITKNKEAAADIVKSFRAWVKDSAGAFEAKADAGVE